MSLDAIHIEKLYPFGIQISARREMPLGQLGSRRIRDLMRSHSLVLFRNFDSPDPSSLQSIFVDDPKRELLHWDFGPVMEMKTRQNTPNYLFSNECVPFHWDGAFHREPSYLVFCCVQAPEKDTGGQTLFSHTQRIWENAPMAKKKLWANVELSYTTQRTVHYGGRIQGPLVRRHPVSGKLTLRFAERVDTELNPVQLGIHGISERQIPYFYEDMVEALYSQKHCYEHSWQTNDVIVADNHLLLHGRREFHNNTPRHLRRIQVL